MVHIRTKHGVTMYDASKSKPETAMDRLCVLWWKNNEKTGRVAPSSRCLSIPTWTPSLTGDDSKYVDLLIEAVEQRQNKAAHKYVTEFLALNGGVCHEVPDEVIAPETILAEFLAEEASEGSSRKKLNGDQIKAWYQEHLKDLVIYAIAEKQGMMTDGVQITDEQAKKLEQFANQYCAQFQKLAAPKPAVTRELAGKLQQVVELLSADTRQIDPVARKVWNKLDQIANPIEPSGEELLDLF